MSGYLAVVRDRGTGGVSVVVVDDWEDALAGVRLIYCQAVADADVVRGKVAAWLEDADPGEGGLTMNDRVAWLVSSAQWIANDHPLQCFRFKDVGGEG